MLASTDSERRLVLVSWTDPDAVQFYKVLNSLLHLSRGFKTGVVNVYVCVLASWWQVQTQKEDWFWYPLQTLVQCNFTQSFTASSILPGFKAGVVNMYVCGIASWWQVQTWKEDWFWYPLQTLVWCNLHGLIQPPPFCLLIQDSCC